MIKTILKQISISVVILAALQSHLFALENSEDAFLESMVFGDIPDVFSALKVSQNIMKAPASITVVTEKEIRLSGARTLADILKYIPGLYVTSSRSGFDLLKVRGAQDRYNNRVLLIIDGIPRRELFYGYTSISDLVPVENIAQVEVIRGPGSALYGTDAYTGVISIFTKTARTAGKLQVDAGYGEFNSKRLNVNYGEVFGDDFDLTFNGRALTSDGYKVDRGRDGFSSKQTTERKGYNLDAKLNYGNFSFLASLSSLDYNYPWAKILRKKDRSEENTALAIKYQNDITDKIGFNTQIYLNRFDFLEDQTIYTAEGSVDEISKSIQENSVLGIDSHIIYQLTTKHQVVAGGAAERESTGRNEELEGTPGQPFEVVNWIQNNAGERDFSLLNYALYLEDVWRINSRFEITMGGRYDQYEQYGDSISPRIGAVYNPIRSMTIKALYGEAFRGPTYKELFLKEYDGSNIIPSSRANPDLEAETIKTAEFEMSYVFNDFILGKIRYFSNVNDNAIISLSENAPYENLDGIETDGLECEVQYSYRDISGYTNLTLNDGKTSAGLPIEGYPDYQVNSVLNYTPSEKIESRLGLRFISNRNRPLDYHDAIDPAAPDIGYLHNVDNLDSYFDLEFSLLYHLSKNWSIAGHIYNLLDDENYNPSYEPGEYWDLVHQGRAFFVNLSYRLPE